MGTIDKIKKFEASRPRNGGGGARGVFHTFNSGDNIVRLVGEFIEVKTHFIAPVKSRKDRGLCIQDAFEGDDKLPMVANCPDWDVVNEKPRGTKTCPICALQKVYRNKAKMPGISAEDKAKYDELAGKCSARTALKWNIIDREDPYIIEVTDKGEKKVLGYKIVTIGMEAWGDIQGIFTQCDFDISDAKEGIDINIFRTDEKKTSYSARAVLEKGSVKKTPLTDEESAMQLHDLKRMCGKQTDPIAMRDALHSDLLQDLIDFGECGSSVSPSEVDDAVEEPIREAPKKSAPVAKVVPKKEVEAEPEDDDAPFDDEDGATEEVKPTAKAKTVAKAEVKEEVKEEAVSASEWPCFGSIDPEHPECKSCSDRDACAEKAGITLK
jgi:hypothetical protein